MEPNHIQARHNLCVVLVEEKRWKDAETCLSDVLQLAPQEDYIKKHLQIVRTQLTKIEQQEQTTGSKRWHLCGRVEDNRWEDAESCLSDILQLAPQGDYFKKHLQIVRGQGTIKDGTTGADKRSKKVTLMWRRLKTTDGKMLRLFFQASCCWHLKKTT